MSALDELRERYRAILADNPGEWLTLRVHYALEAAENIIAELEAAANTSICIFCHKIVAKDLTVILEHAAECEKRPENRLMARIAELEADLLTAVRYGEAQNQALKGCAAQQAATLANRDELIQMVVSLKAALVERERL